MDSKQRISLARWHAEMAALYQRQSEGHRNLMQLPEAAQHQMMAHNHLNTAEVLILLADALDGLTAEDVVAMREREQKATRGPWKFGPSCAADDLGTGVDCRGAAIVLAHFYGKLYKYHNDIDEDYIGGGTSIPHEANAEFCAHSRTDMPRLLTVVEKLMGVRNV
jgi:hypothetical protein